MDNRIQKIYLRTAFMIALIISLLAILLASSLLTGIDRMMRKYVTNLVAADSRQLELNIDNYVDEVQSSVALLFFFFLYYAFDASDESLGKYTKIQKEDEISKRIVDLGLMKNYSDFAIVYANDDTVGWLSQTTDALFPDGGTYKVLSGYITDTKTMDSWVFGLKGNTERLYYIKRLNPNAVVVISFYGKELESVFRYPDELGNMAINLVDKDNRIMYSSVTDDIGGYLPAHIADLTAADGRQSTIDKDYLVASATCTNGWRVVCSIPSNEVLSMNLGLRRFTVIYTFVISAVFCVIILIFFRILNRPVNGIVENLNEKASTDQLTGLLNKSTFQFLADDRIKTRSPEESVAFIIFDLDNFKGINDTYGHPYGDEVLAKTGRLMTASFGKNHLTGRIGGDEFAVCMYFKNDDPSADIRESAGKEFEQFHRNFKKTFENNPAIDISAGLIIADSSEKTFDEIYKRADELLYRSKSMGKGMISYD